MSEISHSVVVAAYGNSPYLKSCLESLAGQTGISELVISTSTPFEGLPELAAAHGARLAVFAPNLGIGNDWNNAYASTHGQLVTIAHQDDVYAPEFSATIMQHHLRYQDAAFSFCGSDEILADGSVRSRALNQRIKDMLVGTAFLGRTTIHGRFSKRLLLGFGNPILCPSVTINRVRAADFSFREDLRTNMDWLAWISLARDSSVIRIREALVRRRVHPASETAACLTDGSRAFEDRLVFDSIWPSWLAGPIASVYKASYNGYMN